jgi:hypothetical protein
MNLEWWYLDLRRYGSIIPHSGFDFVLLFITAGDIRDVPSRAGLEIQSSKENIFEFRLSSILCIAGRLL